MPPAAVNKDITKLQDGFISFWIKVFAWAKKHQKRIYTGLSVLIALGLLIWGYLAYQGFRERTAWSAYESILVSLGQEMQKPGANEQAARDKAIAGLNRLLADHSGRKAALQAHLELAAWAVEQRKFDEAAAHYLAFYNGVKADDSFRPMAASALGRCYEGLKKFDQAAEWYRRSGENPEMKALSLWNLGRVQFLAGQKDQARQTYQDLVKNHGQTLYAALAKDRLLALSQ